MSFHPNEIARRARIATWALLGIFGLLISAFFKTQVVNYTKYSAQSETNRLREVPLPAPRGIIYDRNNQVIAENVPGYAVSIMSASADSLRAALTRLSAIIPIAPEKIDLSVRRFSRSRNRPVAVLADASFDVVSVLEERRIDFPGLIIQSAPKRYYPDGAAVSSFVGYVGEVTETELTNPRYLGYKTGQSVGKNGLERQYEGRLRGREGVRFVEVDALGRVVREAGAREEVAAESAAPLYTNIDLPLQRFMANIFGDSLQGGAIAIDPKTGGVLAMYSAPSYDPNRFVGGIPAELWKSLNADPRRPLFNKVTQGRYPPGSTWKLATAAVALERGLVKLDDRMPVACTGGYQFGNRYFHCWEPKGHGNLTLAEAIEKSCDVYFYQLGLKVGLSSLVAGGIKLGARDKTAIDLPDEARPTFPYDDVTNYYNRKYGKNGWSQAVVLNLSIGQGENAQTVVSMARFYTALATDGSAAKPEVVRDKAERTQILQLSAEQLTGLRAALAGVISNGTAGSARIEGVVLAGKTGTAQNTEDPLHHHAWFVGYAPAGDPKIVVAVMLEFGGHGTRAARIASKIIQSYLHVAPTSFINTDG